MRTSHLVGRALAGSLFVLLSACHTPAPYDAGGDCPKEAYCGQCASHGACAWCGDPADGSRGQCVAVGRADCAAPSEWAKTPDRCAPPPLETKSVAPATTEAAEPSPAAKALGPQRYAAIKGALARVFPQANVTDEIVVGISEVLELQGLKPPDDSAHVMSTEKAPITRRVKEKEHRLYLGQANHHRVKSVPPASAPVQSEFMLELPMVRVTLPATLSAESATIATEIGDVDLAKDHLLGSVDQIDAKYGGAAYLGWRPARVDLITPARSAGWRFGAIAVYLGYKQAKDRTPSFYMLEAGTATGDAKMIYFSPAMKPISNVTSYYVPTPFVTMRNTYSGGITMQAAPNEDEPDELTVESRSPGEKDPYITVTVKYKRAREIDLPMPIELTVDAAARVALIARKMGVPSGEPMEGLLADLGRTFHWIKGPESAVPAATAPAAGTATPAATAPPAETANPAAKPTPPSATPSNTASPAPRP